MVESETNGSLAIGVIGSDCASVVITAAGCSVLVAVGRGSPVLSRISSLARRGARGPRALAEGCDRTLRSVHHLPPDFTLTLTFDNPVNTHRFLPRLG